MTSTQRTDRRPVVVGVEGSSANEALLWAARIARARGAELTVVHAIGHPLTGYELTFDEAIEQSGKHLLAREAARAEAEAPGLTVRTEIDRDTPARSLTARSKHAGLVVVGSHRLSAMERVLAGSLSYQVVAGSHCPVAVVPRLADAGADRVVVGADGSHDSVAAVAYGAAEADRLGLELHVVHSWEEPALYLGMEYLAGGLEEQVVETERVVLAESVAGIAERYPDLPVHQHLVEGRPATVLLAAADRAAVLVVGSRGRQGVARMLLGSVSHAVVLNAPCPVVVVRS